MEYQIEEGDPLLRLRCSVIPNLNTGIYNSATNHTINYHHNTDGGGVDNTDGGVDNTDGRVDNTDGEGVDKQYKKKRKRCKCMNG